MLNCYCFKVFINCEFCFFSDASIYNLKGIIFSGDAFDLPADQPIEADVSEVTNHPMMLLNPSTSVKQSHLGQSEIVYEAAGNPSSAETVFVEHTIVNTSQTNTPTAIQVIDSSCNRHAFADDVIDQHVTEETSVLLEHADSSLIEQVAVDNQVSVVEYIVQAEGVTLTATNNDDVNGDSFFT